MATSSAGSLYRILSFDRGVQIFERGEIHFAHPLTWADPYEVKLRHIAAISCSDNVGVLGVFQTPCGESTPPITLAYAYQPVRKNFVKL
jgi:hypothetical protein